MSVPDAVGFSHHEPLPDEEDFHPKPPTELIADEYDHIVDKKVFVNIFINDSYKHMINIFCQELAKIEDASLNVYPIENWKQIQNQLNNIRDEPNMKALIIIFACDSKEEATFFLRESKETIRVYDIFNKFVSNICQELKYKAKIFLFCPIHYKSPIEHDSRRIFTYKDAYDIPTEADMLIIYKKLELNSISSTSEKITYFDHLGQNISKHGKKWDIIEVITNIDHKDSVPLVISTLTRKFYFLSNPDRGHHLSINEHHENLSKTLETIKNKINLTRKDKKNLLQTKTIEKDSGKSNNKKTITDIGKSSSVSDKKTNLENIKSQTNKPWQY